MQIHLKAHLKTPIKLDNTLNYCHAINEHKNGLTSPLRGGARVAFALTKVIMQRHSLTKCNMKFGCYTHAMLRLH